MKTLLLVDLSHVFISAWHSSADLELGAAFERTLEAVWKLEPHLYDKTVLCCDSPPYSRKALLAEYKANRDAPEQAMLEQFRRVKERLGRDYPLAAHAGAEADDLAASFVHQARGVYDVTIATADKDLMQLVSPTVRIQSTRTKDVFDEAAVFAKFGVHPMQMREWLALTGDKSDNVPGVAGVGPVKAAWLLNIFDSLEGIRKAVESEDERITPAMMKSLKAAFDAGTVELAFSLVGLDCDVPVKLDELKTPEPLEERMQREPGEDFEDEDIPDEIGGPQPPSERPPAPAPQDARQPMKDVQIERYRDAPLAATSFEMGLEPPSMGEAYRLAKAMHASRLYSRFPTPESVFAVIIRGRELGLGALTALDNFHIVEGKPTMAAHLIHARAEEHPCCEYLMCTESSSEKATFVTKHRNHPKETALSYTMAQARDAGLCKPNSGWTKHPDSMLRKSAVVKLVRLVYPSAVAGLYAPEELGGEA